MAFLTNGTSSPTALSSILRSARAAQRQWASTSVTDRLRVVRRLRHLIAEHGDQLASAVRRPIGQTLTAEILPLAEACRYMERKAEALLAPKRLADYSPVWMKSVELQVHREPFGVVLVIGPSNYPLFLPGVQTLQALVAGNAVVLKPGRDGWQAASRFVELLRLAGIPSDLAVLLDESPVAAQDAIDHGVDKVVITGSKETGVAVLSALAPRLIPAVAELSGWDPVFLLQDADLALATAAIRFGLDLNYGNTCIRPRVVYGRAEALSQIRERLDSAANDFEFVCVQSDEEALVRAESSEYALGASVFGSADAAKEFATRIRAGMVVINDMIVPTAHPAVPFGGRGASGFGVTRGAEGLLELTTIKTIAIQRSRWRPHFQAPRPADSRLFLAFLRMIHGASVSSRLRACGDLLRAARDRRQEN